MSLARSKESKSSNKRSLKKLIKTILYATSCIIIPFGANAQISDNSFAGSGSIISILLSLCLVIGIIFSLAWLARRFNVAQAGNGQLKIVASMLAGGKEKIMVIEVGDEQHLLGVTAHNINHLAKLDTPLNLSHTNNQRTETASHSFKNKLLEAMAKNIRGNDEKGTT
ncbi:MAG: flagellar biosynthetic protein FliO [Pseudomonadota bacterium]